MIKIIKKIFVFTFILLTYSCSYKPIFLEKDYSFEIGIISLNGKNEINRVIKNKLSLIKTNSIKEKKIYDIFISSGSDINIISKDSKGDPLKFELVISVRYEIKKNGKLLFSKDIEKSNIYNNISDKFELQQNELIITENLSEKVADIIISSIINLDDN